MSVSDQDRLVWSVEQVVRKRRLKRYGLLFFLELGFLAVMTALCFMGFSLMAENEIAGAVAAIILATAIVLSPLNQRLVNGVTAVFRHDSENWDHYFND